MSDRIYVSPESDEVLVVPGGVEIISVGTQGPPGPTGATGPAGPGVPTGGTTGQLLFKDSDADFDTAWQALVSDDIPNLAASKITSGEFDAARIPDLPASQITSGQLPLERGGTEADLSATGPGVVIQASEGAALSVVEPESFTAPTGTTSTATFDTATVTTAELAQRVKAIIELLEERQIVALQSPLLANLVSYWRLDESSGNRADSVSTNHLTPTNSPTAITGKINNGVGLTRTDSDYLSVASNSQLQTGDVAFWLACWVRPTTVANTQDYVGKYQGAGNNREYNIALGATGASARATFSVTPAGTGTGLATVSTAVGSCTAGNWHLIVAYHDPTNNLIGISIDNAAFVTQAYTTGVFVGNAAFAIGRSGEQGYADAEIDEVGFWKGGVPTAALVNLLWNNGNGTSYPFEPALTVTAPTPYRVYQRSGSTGNISITGTVYGAASNVEARFNGGAWATIASSATGAFTGTLTNQSQGQGLLEIRKAIEPDYVVRVDRVGIGDVFIIAGQSNASGRGTFAQVYSHATLRAALFANDYLWKDLTDPTDRATNQVDSVSSDAAFNPSGSAWPLLATLIMADQSVPVAFVPCALGATTISQWQPGSNHQDRTTLYGSMVYRALQTGCKVVLWWQGESDALAATSQATYNAALDTLANTIFSDLGVRLMPCLLQNSSGASDAAEQAIRDATSQAWGDNANVLTGPDFSDIASDDSFHLQTNTKLQTAADRWWAALEAEFYP